MKMTMSLTGHGYAQALRSCLSLRHPTVGTVTDIALVIEYGSCYIKFSPNKCYQNCIRYEIRCEESAHEHDTTIGADCSGIAIPISSILIERPH